MFLLPSLALGFVFALLLGGDLKRLLDVRLRLTWSVPAALAIQVLVFHSPVDVLSQRTELALHVVSYVLLLTFVSGNVRIRALLPVLLGVALNGIVITVNGGLMPVSEAAAKAADLTIGPNASVSTATERLAFLGDVFAIPAGLPLANVFSVGDLLIGFGMIAFIVVVATSGGHEPALRFSRLVEPFHTRSYRMLATGKLISHLGDWLTLAALVGWIYEQTGSTGNVAALLLARLGPPILGAGVAAVIVDRYSRRGLILTVELLRGVAVAVALVGVITGSLPLVLIVLACSGALAALSAATVPALVPSLLEADQLAPANAGLGIARDGAMAVGALAAGVALSWFGVAQALVVDLVSFGLAFLFFLGVKVDASARLRKRAPGSSGGLRYLLRRRRLLLLVLSFASATLATGLANATFPGFFDIELGLGSGGYGFAFAALASGLTLGQALVGFARASEAASRWIGGGLLVMASFFVLLALGTHLPTALLVIAAIGFVDGTTDVLFETFVQQEADPEYYGAVFGLSSAFMTTTMIGAIAAAPLLNDSFRPSGVILGASAFLVVAGTIALVGMMRTPSRAPQRTELREGFRLAKLLRPGEDISLITWGDLVPAAEQAANALATEISVEIVSLPLEGLWNRTAVLRSVAKTSKVLVLHYDGPDERFAAEVAAVIADQGFEDLDAPVRRVSVAHDDVIASLRALAKY